MRLSPRHSVLQTHTLGGKSPAWWSPPVLPVYANPADKKGLRQRLVLLAQTVTITHIQPVYEMLNPHIFVPAGFC